ncbi:MAG TPA: VWA domain-containing protein [Candidatus Kapabacteria bacterium]|nr:VWA domain-containing protein [Candidatus Kapabacteria bacterium]
MEEIAVNFGHPKLLWVGMLILPLLGLFLWATWRKRQALIRSFVQNKNLAQLTLGTSTARQKIRRVLLLFAVASLLFTIARPQWGFTWEEATQRGRDIIVAIDTSRSMLAGDLQPNRLTRAKLAALDLLKLGKFDRFALVAFSGTAFLQCPLTFDDEAFRQSVQILEPGIIPQGGTALNEAINAARRAFSEDADENHRVLVLFTDGEDHEEGVMQTVSTAATEGMRIFTVGVGTPSGELLRIRDERGNPAYVKDDAGNVVKSRLNEPLLQEIAAKAGGFYLSLQDGNAMQVLYQKGLAPMPTSERSSKLLKKFKEQFYWPLSIAILLLILEVFIPETRRAPRTKVEPVRPALVTLLLLLLSLPATHASASRAQRYYRTGEYDRSLKEYQESLAKKPNDPRLHYNAGAAAYQANKFDLALKEFQAAAASPEIDLQQQAFYNLGNSAFRLGEETQNPQEKIAIWEQAVQHFDAAIKLRSGDKDAEFNRDFVRQKLEELKKQQPQQNNNQDNKDKDKQDKDDQNNKDKNDSQQQKENDPQQQDQKEQKQDQQNQQQSSQEQKDQQEKKQQEQQQDQQKQSQEKENQQANNSKPQQSGDKQSDQQKPESEGQGEAAQLGKMTPAQAKQLLDAQKNEEKALIFVPKEPKSGASQRTFKDW